MLENAGGDVQGSIPERTDHDWTLPRSVYLCGRGQLSTAVILAGGKGTRLEPFTVSIPKPLLPLGQTPILEVLLRQLAANRFRRVVLSLGHMAPFFVPFLERWRNFGPEITIVQEHEPLGTAGPLRLVPDLEETFLVMNGDILTTLDYRHLLQSHTAHGASGTIAISRRELKVDYGVVRSAPDGALVEYEEKPVLTYAVSMGINVLSKEALQFVPADSRMDIPELMRALVTAGRRVLCHQTDCYWQDIGRFDDYQRADKDFQNDPSKFIRA